MIHWAWLIVAAFTGTAFGVGMMCLLHMLRPGADDAIFHLSRLYRRMVGPLDAVIFTPPGGVVDNARRFLLQWGEGEGV